jgi:DnaJ-domain-containing protein 1
MHGHVSIEQARFTYRNLMRQYHPDRVAHLGPELRELAERKAKEFNIAMDYLAKHLPQMS